jgi:hypothetical protein
MHHQSKQPSTAGRIRGVAARAALMLGATAAVGLSVAPGTAAAHVSHVGGQTPVHVAVLTPGPGESTSSAFNVDVVLQSKNAQGNRLLSGYSTLFNDPTGPDGMANPAFHPGASSAAPGLVVTLSTTPSVPGTPLVGARTNLAGVFQLNSITRSHGLISSWNDWQVTSPGFFGKNTRATLTVYAVNGKAPNAVPAGGLKPISNVVKESISIGS